MNKFMKRWLLMLVTVGAVWGGVASQNAQAANSSSSSSSASNNIGYSVAAEIPKNQINKKNSFFDLKMTMRQTQTLKAVLYNSSNKELKIATAIHTAYTNSNGLIEYINTTKTYDQSLEYKMSNITKLNTKTVTVPANGSKVVTAQVTMPSGNFNGVILGGWYFKRIDDKVTGSVKGSMNIKNEYSYVIGMKYTVGKAVTPNMKLTKVKAGLENYHKGIFPYLQNPTAVIIPNLTIKSTITDKQTGKTVKTAKKTGVQMAPNSTFRYPLLLGKTELQAGKYHIKMVVKNTDYTWTFNQDFTISQKDAKTYNKKAVDNSGINIWWLIGLGALAMLIIILIIGLIIYFIIKKRRQKDSDD
ncbi:cell surface protein [Lactobacillus sp. CBA3606]|uniref:DUF916 and DUF3324 domain-containing protein n=1 Tax=Lactobacillus sp. CBA3606 TaxID=2099789 RepID=UPI000CFD0AF7|nr:DUF916 and DUF3324 domain-containing protein [Lactobacillus sp. CBA3606]AVK64088.1 cell surface protein [Lactobacillus sp. CBA3606]